MRTGELCALAWEDIDLEEGIITIRRNITPSRVFKLPKNEEERTIYLLPPAIDALRNQKLITGEQPAAKITKMLPEIGTSIEEEIKVVFPPWVQCRNHHRNLTYIPASRGESWRNIVRRAGVRYRNQYQSRHTYATWALTYNGNIAYVADQLGHKDVTITAQIYTKWLPNESKAENARIWANYQKKMLNK